MPIETELKLDYAGALIFSLFQSAAEAIHGPDHELCRMRAIENPLQFAAMCLDALHPSRRRPTSVLIWLVKNRWDDYIAERVNLDFIPEVEMDLGPV